MFARFVSSGALSKDQFVAPSKAEFTGMAFAGIMINVWEEDITSWVQYSTAEWSEGYVDGNKRERTMGGYVCERL